MGSLALSIRVKAKWKQSKNKVRMLKVDKDVPT